MASFVHPDEPAKAEDTAGQPTRQQTGATPSGVTGGNPATAGAGKTDVHSKTPENAAGHLNPSSPEDANTTPGSGTVK